MKLATLLATIAVAFPTAAAEQFLRLPDLPENSSATWMTSWGDYDRDGDLDLLIANGATVAAQRIDLHRNRGDGTFDRMTADQVGPLVSELGYWIFVAWVDIDNDGWLDVMAAATAWRGGTTRTPCLFRNRHDGTFQLVAGGEYAYATLAEDIQPDLPFDLNGDGWVDLFAVQSDPAAPHALFFNRADGSFGRDRTSPIVKDLVAPNADYLVDFDLDGDMDVFVADVRTASAKGDRLYLNDGRGGFTIVTNLPFLQTPGWTVIASWGDIDNDGDFDVVLSKEIGPVLFRNDAGSFVAADLGPTGGVGGAHWIDYDNDGLLDLFIQRNQSASGTNSLLRNLGDGTFRHVTNALTSLRTLRQGANWADIDNDGDMDLVESLVTGGTHLYRNLGNANHWLKIVTQGLATTAEGRGSLVRVKANIGGRPVRQMHLVGATVLGDPRPNFGLGDATMVDEVRVDWPSGNVTVLTNVAADQVLSVVEPVNILPRRPVATVNGRVELSSSSLPNVIERQWYFEGTPLDGQTNTVLVLTNVQPSQAGRYTLAAQGQAGPVSRHVYLRVLNQFTKVLEGEVVTEAGGTWYATWWDYDNDRNLDLLVNNAGDTAQDTLFHNDGAGQLIRVTDSPLVTRATGSAGAAVGDYDNDGLTDALVVSIDRVHLYRNRGLGTFVDMDLPPLTSPRIGGILGSWSDYNLDGRLDLFVAFGYVGSSQRYSDSLFRGLADGSFEAVSTNEVGEIVGDRQSSWSGVWFDYDGDGAQDLLVVHAGILPRLYHNDRDGTFTRAVAGSLPGSGGDGGAAAVGDYDNDGWLDLVLPQWGLGRNALHRNFGNGRFADLTRDAGFDFPSGVGAYATWVDYDNDGYLDLFFTTYDLKQLYRNRGDGTFHPVDIGNLRTDGVKTDGGSWGDYDNNGFPDLLLTCGDGDPQLNHLYRNAGNSNHWLAVTLDGRTSNRSGIGAKIRLTATIGGRTFTQMREIAGNSSAAGGQQLRAHFGLGNATKATKVRVEWPSGVVQELANVAANQVVAVTEGPKVSLACRAEIGGVRIECRGEPNATYTLEASVNLKTWFAVDTLATDGTGAASTTVPPNLGHRIFRAVKR